MQTNIFTTRQALTSPDVLRVIENVNSGAIDSLLKQLEHTPFGVYINAYVVNGVVEQVPAGFSQYETDLKVSLGVGAQEPGVKVGWYASQGTICSDCPPPNDCRSHSNPKATTDDSSKNFPALKVARELIPVPLDLEKYGDLLCVLSKYDLGVFLCHGHNNKFAFTELPQDSVAVVESSRTDFRARNEVVFDENFVPNVWRFENGSREVVGGFLVS